MKKYFTTGELVKITGITKKTIRYYHDIELLLPNHYTEAGYKKYDLESVKTLQRILMLKYLNFSLVEIKEILKENDNSNSFSKQEELIESQISHLNHVLEAVRNIQVVDDEDRWESMLKVINLTLQKEDIFNQYKSSENLQNRINIHTYSTASNTWYEWLFDKFNLKSGMKILEIGCGTGQFWLDMYRQLPENLTIVLTDNSKQMIATARQSIMKYSDYLTKKNIRFEFILKDAEAFEIEDGDFDCIIANHMLYHISNKNRNHLIRISKELLKHKGVFFASTIGEKHLEELFSFVKAFDDRVEIPTWATRDFLLENGMSQLSCVYESVKVQEHNNNLLVNDPQIIVDYVKSWPGNIGDVLKGRDKEFMQYVIKKVTTDKTFFISKSTGLFTACNSDD